MILFISSAGLSACSTVPERAIPLTPRLHNGWNIRYGYSTDGYYRKVYILLLHPACTSKATGSIVSTGVSFMRSCTQRQPPSRAMRAASRYEYRSV